MKRVSTVLALALGSFFTFSSAAQIQGFVTGYAPGNVKEKATAKGVDSDRDLNSGFAWALGAEFLTFPTGPLMVGGGLGFFSVQADGDDNIVMPSVPLWGSVGVIGPDRWDARPYFEARIGIPLPATNYITWWRKPLNFFATAAVGVQLPYNMGVELNWTYLTMSKSYKDIAEIDYRLTSMKFGGSITIHFDLSKKSSDVDEFPVVKEETAAEPAAEDNSYGYSDESANTESLPTEEPSYSDYYSSEPAAEQPAEESVTEEPSAEPYSEETPAEEASAEEPASEDTPAEEASAEETPAEEAAVEAPAEEAVAEPAPEPEPVAKKPAAKKSSKKAKAKKKSSKKSKAKSKKKK